MTKAADYQRGYRAGAKKASANALANDRARVIEAAFVALLPVVFGPDFRWGPVAPKGKPHVPYQTVEERLQFARSTAEKAWLKL